jgi:hypothetical protein
MLTLVLVGCTSSDATTIPASPSSIATASASSQLLGKQATISRVCDELRIAVRQIEKDSKESESPDIDAVHTDMLRLVDKFSGIRIQSQAPNENWNGRRIDNQASDIAMFSKRDPATEWHKSLHRLEMMANLYRNDHC